MPPKKFFSLDNTPQPHYIELHNGYGIAAENSAPPGYGTEVTDMDKIEAINRLKSILKPGDAIPVIIRSVSRSGMSRTMDVYGPDLSYLSGYVALACGYTRTRDGALRVKGCGMDMAFSVVYDLGRALWPDGLGLAPVRTPGGLDIGPDVGHSIRPETREMAAEMFALGWAFRGRIGEAPGWDGDGGYALGHRVL